ncbi:hypothetical protein JCM24511_03263 [Saitozyma sp. JCM 24511]|nr:hypothetical protein JCM24511_03263 [Saitozyma sp. JCM 24511]
MLPTQIARAAQKPAQMAAMRGLARPQMKVSNVGLGGARRWNQEEARGGKPKLIFRFGLRDVPVELYPMAFVVGAACVGAAFAVGRHFYLDGSSDGGPAPQTLLDVMSWLLGDGHGDNSATAFNECSCNSRASAMSDLLSHLSHVPTVAYPLAAGLVTTSSILFGNVGLSLVGPLPIIRGRLGAHNLDAKQRVRVWKLFFDGAATYIVTGTVLTTTLHLLVPFLTRSPLVRSAALVSAASSISIIPFTMVFIMPTNKRLGVLDAQADLSGAEEKEAGELIAKWEGRHNIRYAFYELGWAAGLVALVGAVAGW